MAALTNETQVNVSFNDGIGDYTCSVSDLRKKFKNRGPDWIFTERMFFYELETYGKTYIHPATYSILN